MRKLSSIAIAVMLASGCSNDETPADAYGTFEATEVMVSSEVPGRILSFKNTEGTKVGKGEVLAVMDTTLLKLQESELEAGMRSIRTRMASIDAQNEIIDQQVKNLQINIDRTVKMLKDGAATQKQLDDLQGQESVLHKQKEANNTQKASVIAELALYESKGNTLREQISRCTVRSPLDGTIIQKYSEEGEITAAGKALARIADLSVMKLEVFVSGAQLPEIKTGKSCTVRIDNGEKGYSSLPGTISYISEKAEFTPKIIQTKEERVTLVYAVRIDVQNDGTLKAGMPGEAIFGEN